MREKWRKLEKPWAFHTSIILRRAGHARYSQRQAALSGRSGRHFAGILRHHGHSGKGRRGADDTPSTNASGIAENILAPLPMQGEADSSSTAQDGSTGEQAVTLENFGPAKQSAGAYTVKAYDASVIRQPSCGQVDLSYFADAAFLGDSLTVGFSDYQINLDGALICGYTGVGPDAIVNRSAVKSPTRGQEVALDVLAAARPKKLYILLGTNTLTTLGASDRFLAYYGRCWICCARLWARTA